MSDDGQTINHLQGANGNGSQPPPAKPAPSAEKSQRSAPSKMASFIASAAFLLLLAFLSAIAWQSQKLNLNAAAPAVVTALLGAVLNPPKSAPKNSGVLPLQGTTLWFVLVIVAVAAGVFTGIMSLTGGTHPNASEAFAACVAGLAGLFYDTSSFTVVEQALGIKSKQN